MAQQRSVGGSGRFDVIITPAGFRGRTVGPVEALRGILAAVHKVWHLVRLELRQASFGLYLGNLWLLFEPALQAGAYYFLLTVVFNVQGADSTFAFFYIGVTFWRSHATLASGAPYFLWSKGHQYIEQGFGLSTAFLEMVANEILLLLIRLAVLAFFLIIAGYSPQWTWPLVLVFALVQFTFSMAIHVWLSMLGLVVKDSSRIIGHIVWLWWYMSPGLYSIRRIPDWAQVLYGLNPFAHLIPTYHSLILDGKLDPVHVLPCILIFVVSAFVLWLGVIRMRRFSYTMSKYI